MTDFPSGPAYSRFAARLAKDESQPEDYPGSRLLNAPQVNLTYIT
jgi:hypothetical protein